MIQLRFSLLCLSCFFVFTVIGANAAPTPNRGTLVRELLLPKMALNINMGFSTEELRLPVAADPTPEYARIESELAEAERPELRLQAARLLEQLGLLSQAAEQYEVAAKAYVDIVVADPTNIAAFLALAEATIALGDDEGATACVEEVLIAEPLNARALTLASEIHIHSAVMALNQNNQPLMEQHFASAVENASEAMRQTPQDPHAMMAAFWARWFPLVLDLNGKPEAGLQQLAKFEELGELLKKVYTVVPSFHKLRSVSVICRLTPFFTTQMTRGLEKGLWTSLDEQQQRVLTNCRDELLVLSTEIAEMRTSSLQFAAMTAWMMDDRKSTYLYLRQAADAAPVETDALELMAAFYAYEGNWKQAQVIVEEALKRKETGKLLVWSGRVKAEQGRWKEALDDFKKAATHDDCVSLANLGLGVSLLKTGAPVADAIVPLRTAWEKGANEPEVLLAWGVALALNGQLEEGRSCVADAINRWPRTPSLDRVAKELGLTLPQPGATTAPG